MFNESPEKFSETPKQCLLKKINNISGFFEKENWVNGDFIIDDLSLLKKEIEKLFPQQIAQESHLAHILGNIEMQLLFIRRAKKSKNTQDLGLAMENKNTLKDYLDLLTSNKDFLYGELSSKAGYWEEKIIVEGETEKEITNLSAEEFVEASRQKLDRKKK